MVNELNTNSTNLVDVVKLEQKTYAIISPNKIHFLSDATDADVNSKVEEEKAHLSKRNTTPAFNKEIEGITFLPTLNCNLRCIYCYAKGGERQTNLSEDLAKIALDDLASKTTGTVQIDFAGGGEPF